jgi:hypothetical protein
MISSAPLEIPLHPHLKSVATLRNYVKSRDWTGSAEMSLVICPEGVQACSRGQSEAAPPEWGKTPFSSPDRAAAVPRRLGRPSIRTLLSTARKAALAQDIAALPDGRIERCIGAVRLARVRLGRGQFLSLPERLRNRRSNEFRPPARAGGSNPLQAAGQLVVYLYKE